MPYDCPILHYDSLSRTTLAVPTAVHFLTISDAGYEAAMTITLCL